MFGYHADAHEHRHRKGNGLRRKPGIDRCDCVSWTRLRFFHPGRSSRSEQLLARMTQRSRCEPELAWSAHFAPPQRGVLNGLAMSAKRVSTTHATCID